VTLVEASTGEVVADVTPADARVLTEQIKTSVSTAWNLIAEAYTSRAWAALGYDGWDAYVTAEFGVSRLALPKEERREVVASLRDAGLSTRAIAKATGISHQTAANDLAAGVKNLTPRPEPWPESSDEPTDDGHTVDYGPPDAEPEPPAPTLITGIDGKTYQPKPKPAPLTDDQQEELDLAAGDKRTAAYVVKVLDLWHVIAGLATNVRRSQIIDCLEPADRARLAEIERSIR